MQTHSAWRESVQNTGILEEFRVLKPCENSKFRGEKPHTGTTCTLFTGWCHGTTPTILDTTASNPPFTCSLASRRWAEERIQHSWGEQVHPKWGEQSRPRPACRAKHHHHESDRFSPSLQMFHLKLCRRPCWTDWTAVWILVHTAHVHSAPRAIHSKH